MQPYGREVNNYVKITICDSCFYATGRKYLAMKYLCACYYDQKMFDALTPASTKQLQKACEPHDAAL